MQPDAAETTGGQKVHEKKKRGGELAPAAPLHPPCVFDYV